MINYTTGQNFFEKYLWRKSSAFFNEVSSKKGLFAPQV
jgi:hypothetical protein